MDLNSFWIWLAVNIFSLISLSAYSMLEMACISFDRVRVQYFLTKGDLKIQWLNELLSHSGTLFGTTLIGVNIALVVGSESARQLFSSLGLSPDLSVVPQILIVILFGELAPMFAARRYPDHVIRIGVGLVYYSAKILTPILWLINGFTNFITRWIGGYKGRHETFLGREELQKILEVHEEPTVPSVENAEMNQTISNIFTIGSKTASSIMQPLNKLHLVPSSCTAGELRKIILESKQVFFPIQQEKTLDVVGIVYPRDLLRVGDNRRVRDYARQPWFVEHHLKLLDLLKQFRNNHESLSIVLDRKGKTIGYLTLDHIIESIFVQSEEEQVSMVVVDRTIDPNLSIGQLEQQLGIHLNLSKDLNFAEFCKEKLENHPHVGDTFTVENYEVTILESSVFDIQKVKIKTKLF